MTLAWLQEDVAELGEIELLGKTATVRCPVHVARLLILAHTLELVHGHVDELAQQ